VDVHIRPYRQEDTEAAFEAVRESLTDLLQWMPWAHPEYSIADTRSWIDAQIPAFRDGTAYEFAVESDAGRYLGACGVNQIDQANRRANLGYWIRSGVTRQGVATAAVRAVRDWAFEHTNLVRLEIVVAVGNVASERVAEKSGATREGTLRNRLFLHGAVRDAMMFSLTRDPPAGTSER